MDVVVWIVAVIVWGAASGAWMVFGRLVAKSRPNKDALEDAIDTSRKWRKELMADWDRQFRKLSGEPEPGATRIESPWQEADLYLSNMGAGTVSWSSGGVTYTQTFRRGTMESMKRGCRCTVCQRAYLDGMASIGYPESIYGSPVRHCRDAATDIDRTRDPGLTDNLHFWNSSGIPTERRA